MSEPTIGIEIELPWRTMLGRVDSEAAELLAQAASYYRLDKEAKARVQQGFDDVDAMYKDRLGDVFGEHIVEKSDGFTEFAFRPKDSAEQILDVAAHLSELDLLRDDEVYPLHVTLGGIAARNSSWLILMAAELSGGASAERMKQVNTWSGKGQAGVKERHPAELQLGAEVGIELRSLEMRGLDNLAHTLQIVQNAGSLLLRKLAGGRVARHQWIGLFEVLMSGTEQKGVDARRRWRNPQVDVEPWSRLSCAMEDEVWLSRMHDDIDTILLD
jgi:hypothetical protein